MIRGGGKRGARGKRKYSGRSAVKRYQAGRRTSKMSSRSNQPSLQQRRSSRPGSPYGRANPSGPRSRPRQIPRRRRRVGPTPPPPNTRGYRRGGRVRRQMGSGKIKGRSKALCPPGQSWINGQCVGGGSGYRRGGAVRGRVRRQVGGNGNGLPTPWGNHE